MKMENQEEILILLERFTKSKQKDIPRELEDYLNFVARTGDTLYGWVLVKPLFREKLVNVITDFHDNTPSIADLPQCPNVDPFNYERMKLALLDRLDSFNSAPFTVQRICELLTEPRKQYTRIDKFMRAVEKNILVVSTQEPGRRRSESENGDSLDSIVNGDLEVNVDIEMDNEQFNLEADALLPDSSDPVGSLHNALADVGQSLEREGDIASQLNGTRGSGGVFLNSESNQFDAAPKSGLNDDEEDNRAVIDTNENATDGDIGGGTSMLEDAENNALTTAGRKSEEAEELTTGTDSSTGTDKLAAGIVDEKDETEADKSTKQDTFGLQKTMEQEAKLPEATCSSEPDAVDEEKPTPTPSTAGTGGSSDEEEQQTALAQTTAADEGGEPQAKMGKYDVVTTGPITPSDSTDSSSGSDAEARSADGSSSSFSSSSSTSEGKQIAEEKAPEVASSTNTEATAVEVEPQPESSAVGPSSKSEETTESVEEKLTTNDVKGDEAVAEDVGSPADVETQQQQPHSKSEEDYSAASAVDTELKLKKGEVELASSNISSSSSVETELKKETSPNVDSVSVSTAILPDVDSTTTPKEAVASSSPVEEGIDIEVAPGVTVSVTGETEMDEEEMANVMGNEASAEEASKGDPDDNVMDVDESSVEPMDQ
uniref:Serine/threonine-protein phosphatase 4 regulatory subunit 2 n=1 Tax=Anopheles atroparvus TaxID=41427 RepID=A0AAG5D557_ANOAO